MSICQKVSTTWLLLFIIYPALVISGTLIAFIGKKLCLFSSILVFKTTTRPMYCLKSVSSGPAACLVKAGCLCYVRSRPTELLVCIHSNWQIILLPALLQYSTNPTISQGKRKACSMTLRAPSWWNKLLSTNVNFKDLPFN